MQKIKIISIGKLKNLQLKKEIEELSKRIPRLEFIELKEIKAQSSKLTQKKECEVILSYLDSKPTFLLTEEGKEYSTQEFAKKLLLIEQPITFIISGAYGPSDELKKKVTNHLSLSQMIFTHEQALYMLVEQLYRVWCIEKNIPYTK